MSEQRIDLKNRLLATGLAWFVPGLGHAYQGRWFKAILYSVCIWSTWGCGWVLGDGKVVYYNMDMKRGRWTAGYATQVMVGSAALPALIQTRRASPGGRPEDRERIELHERLAGQFNGALVGLRFKDMRTAYFKVRGQIEVEPSGDDVFRQSISGRFKGTVHRVDENNADVPDGTPVEAKLLILRSLEPEVFPSPHREVICQVEGQVAGVKGGEFSADLRGKVLNSRGLFDRYAAPLDAPGLEEAHGELGKYFEIALVYTWVAGLLNVLAMWDAYEGPAYGYGDEEPPAGTPAEGTAVTTAAASNPSTVATTTPVNTTGGATIGTAPPAT